MDALAAQNILAALLRYKLKWEYSDMFGFVRSRMSRVIVRYNSLLLRSPPDKWVRIQQQPELTDGAVMALILPWGG